MRPKLLLVAAAAAASMVALIAVPGTAQADGTGDFCTASGSACLSMNGTTGDQILTQAPSSGNAQQTSVTGYLGCTHEGEPSEYVQYKDSPTHPDDTTYCPFTDTTLDADLVGDEIVFISNIPSSEYAQGKEIVSPYLDQAGIGSSGEEFIKAPSGVYVNVLVSDFDMTQMYLCTDGLAGSAVDLSSSQADIYCDWSF